MKISDLSDIVNENLFLVVPFWINSKITKSHKILVFLNAIKDVECHYKIKSTEPTKRIGTAVEIRTPEMQALVNMWNGINRLHLVK